jgi:hypothetical protein
MQTQNVSAARWAAVLSLQNRRSRLALNSFEFDVADHAIDLVLNAGRPEGPYLLQNALKDARSVVIRQKRRTRARGMVPLLDERAGTGPLEVSRSIEADRTVADARPRSIEVQLGWRQEFQGLHAIVSAARGRTGSVLTGWLGGEDLADTAKRLAISTHYVKKLRGEIRLHALEMAEHRRAA